MVRKLLQLEPASPSLYDISPIASGLNREESIIHIADALEQLSLLADDVFKQITNSIESRTSELKSLDERVVKAQQRVESLRRSVRASVVFCPNSYPKQPGKYESPFSGLNDSEPIFLPRNKPLFSYHSPELSHPLTPFQPSSAPYTPTDVKIKTSPTPVYDRDEGLGSLPPDVEDVSSFLLFNTTENPFKKYHLFDPLEGVINKTRRIVEEERRLTEMPYSLTQTDNYLVWVKENISYAPRIGRVPSLDIPSHLPSLPGVASDLLYSAGQGPSIAPSCIDLPEDLPDVVLKSEPKFIEDVLLPPSPPPPPDNMPLPVQARPSIEKNIIVPTAPSSSIVETSGAKELPPLPAVDDDRGNLMAAIIAAAGKPKLKRSKERKQQHKEEKERATVMAGSKGGDFMGELFSAIVRRRKCIAGTGKPPQPQDDNIASDDEWDEQ